jgi:two-component system, NarL family, sensor histidine kinase UhpB
MPIFWRVFAVNAGLLALIAVLLLLSPVEISYPIKPIQALIVLVGLAITLVANILLLRRAVAPLERLVERMDRVDLLRPGQRLQVSRDDEVGRVLRAFNQMLDRLESERQRSGRRVLAAQEAERLGIARDLHDEVGQLLTGVLLHLDSSTGGAPEHRDEIEEAKRAVRRALDEVRRISRELRPEMLEDLGLVSALTELSTSFGRSGVRVERRFDTSLPKLEPDTELAVYRIAQESLTNVARHSNASRVTITLERGPDSVVLRIVDDGRGFDSARSEEHGGLRSMRERALLVGGALAIEQVPTGGVEVRLEVPATPVAEPLGAPS